MQQAATLWDLEEHFWTGELDNARATTAKGAVMIFPYPDGILQGDAIWQRLNSAFPWRSIEMTDRNLTRQADIAVLAYRATAERQDAPIYEALCTSTYLRDDKKWVRMSHQQTPLS